MLHAIDRRIAVAALAVGVALAPAAFAQSGLGPWYATNTAIFAAICATSIGFNSVDARACGQSIFNSQLDVIIQAEDIPEAVRKGAANSVAMLLSNTLAGNTNARFLVQNFFAGGAPVPYVQLNIDPCDAFLSNGNGGCTAIPGRGRSPAYGQRTLNQVLTDEQEALLGCGPFWGTDCEADGIDLTRADGSVLLQSLVGFTGGLPGGARGPADPSYTPFVDGCVDPNASASCGASQPLVSPGLSFPSEMAALSWNMLMTLVAFSAPPLGLPAAADEFDAAQPQRTGEGLCSFSQPQFCSSVVAFFGSTSGVITERPSLRQRAATCIRRLWTGDRTIAPDCTAFSDGTSVVTGLPVRDAAGGDSIASLLANALAGNAAARLALQLGFTHGALVPLVPLRADPCDGFTSDTVGGCTQSPSTPSNPAWASGGAARTLNQLLSDEQEALLGCGRFWGTNCEAVGIDVLQAEASVLMQSWPGVQGEYGPWVDHRRRPGCETAPPPIRGPRPPRSCERLFPVLDDYCIGCLAPDGGPHPVPGTLGFDAPPVGVRAVTSEGIVQHPGARGPGDTGHDLEEDGSTTGLVIPVYDDPARGVSNGFGSASGTPFRSEMAALSWNALMTLVALSAAEDPAQPAADELDPEDPARTGPGLCSFRQPQFCRTVAYPIPEPAKGLGALAAWLALGCVRRRASSSAA